MELIQYVQRWDYHKSTHYIKMDIDKVVYSFEFNTLTNPDEIVLSGVYVQEDYRGNNYFCEIMDIVSKLVYKKIWIQVLKDSSIINKYKEYGFVYEFEYDDKFDWYSR